MQNFLDLPKSPFIMPTQIQYSPSDLVYVDMYQAVVTSSDAVGPRVLFTSSITTCCGLAVYNPQNTVAGLTHLVADADDESKLSKKSTETLGKMIGITREGIENESLPIEARIIGPHVGGKLARPFLEEIIDFLLRARIKF